ncbi:hypothetical protein ACFPZ0_14045 [Streptomonospora nanhaiensis]|uniref:Uncharacterized protein n=1 Tax=Streptomonospora nanhaiensis TaxID=1323731 RepID=A0A853BLZ1_9ACTN|nr:hypothetical protein [Streptomonospora nanhaiensis]NYI95687.1 hypothetical protein [Streptomonospora nanhaiensis]
MRRRRSAARHLAPVVVIGLAGSLVAAPAAADDTGGVPAAPVEWGACREDVAAQAPELRCATVPVPLDYTDPQGAAIDIMVSRLAAPGPRSGAASCCSTPAAPAGPG